MRLRQVLRQIGQAESGQRRIEHLGVVLKTSWPSTRTFSSRPPFSNSQA